MFRTGAPAGHAGAGETGSRWRAEAAYGFPAFSGRFTGSPHVGLDLAADTRDFTIGWRLTPARHATGFSPGVEATRRTPGAAAAEHMLGLEVSARW